MFELDNKQREYLGLEPVLKTWDKLPLKGDAYRPDTILYFEGEIIKKHIHSSDTEYKETQYNEETENREWILPKTKKGKAKKLTASVLETRTPLGVYFTASIHGDFLIGNHTSQTTFYSRDWEKRRSVTSIPEMIDEFISSSPKNHKVEIEKFRLAKRKKLKYKAGDFFAFKINRTEYGLGRILFDVNKARKRKLLTDNHGLNLLMGPPLLIKIYAYKSDSKKISLDLLKSQKALPSDYIMDNLIFYGEYDIIGHRELEADDFEFPISYGRSIDYKRKVIFLQWGLIHIEKPLGSFDKYLAQENGGLGDHNPYGYYSIGFRPIWDAVDIEETIKNDGCLDFTKGNHYKIDWDLRNPKNDEIRAEILTVFGLDPTKSYEENRKLTNSMDILELINDMKL